MRLAAAKRQPSQAIPFACPGHTQRSRFPHHHSPSSNLSIRQQSPRSDTPHLLIRSEHNPQPSDITTLARRSRRQQTGQNPFHIAGAAPVNHAINHTRLSRAHPVSRVRNGIRMAHKREFDHLRMHILSGRLGDQIQLLSSRLINVHNLACRPPNTAQHIRRVLNHRPI